MALKVYPRFFKTIEEALDDVKKNGTWPTTLVSGPSEGRPVHWHSEEVHAYIMEGETDFLDGESGKRIPLRQGDKLVVPARALHAEGPVKSKVVYLIAVPKPLLWEDFLLQRDPADIKE